jgi:small-conductance mechanosensitive channel
MVKIFDTFEVDLPDYLNNQWAEFLILLVIWLLIGILVILAIRMLTSLTIKTEKTDVDDKVLKVISSPSLLMIFGYGAIQSLKVLDIISDSLIDSMLFAYKALVAIMVVYLAYKIFGLVFIPMASGIAKKRKKDFNKTVFVLFESVGGVIVLLFGFFWVLTVLGINVTVFLAGAGIAGLVIAFAMQDTLSHYFSGLHLMLDKPFEIGDVIEVEGDFLEVIRVGMRSTRLYNIFDHEIEIVPNNLLANQTISNVTAPDTEFRVWVKVGVAYGSPIDKVKEIILEAVTSNDRVVINDGDKRPSVGFIDFGDNALEFRVRFFVKDVLEQWSVTSDVREHIDRRFREEGIVIPFPQRTLSILPPERDEVVRVQSVDPKATAVPTSQ